MSPFASPVSLQGQHVQLMPLNASYHDDLVLAVQDGDLWNHWYTAIPHPEAMQAEIARRLDLQARGSRAIALRAKQHLFGLSGVDHDRDHHVAGSRQFG